MRLLLIHLQHVGTMGDVLEAHQHHGGLLAAQTGLRSRRTGGDRWSDDEAEDQRHHEDERRHPDETGAVSRFGSERVQLVSLTLDLSFTFHADLIPRGETPESRSNGHTSPLRADRERRGHSRANRGGGSA